MLGFPDFKTIGQISRQSVHEGGKVVSLTHRPLLTQETILVLISVRGWNYPQTKSQWHHRESNPRPSGMYRGAST